MTSTWRLLNQELYFKSNIWHLYGGSWTKIPRSGGFALSTTPIANWKSVTVRSLQIPQLPWSGHKIHHRRGRKQDPRLSEQFLSHPTWRLHRSQNISLKHTDRSISKLKLEPSCGSQTCSWTIRTLYHRADTVVTDDLDRREEKSHVNNALAKCGYPMWALERAVKPKQKKVPPANAKLASKGPVAISYVKMYLMLK